MFSTQLMNVNLPTDRFNALCRHVLEDTDILEALHDAAGPRHLLMYSTLGHPTVDDVLTGFEIELPEDAEYLLVECVEDRPDHGPDFHYSLALASDTARALPRNAQIGLFLLVFEASNDNAFQSDILSVEMSSYNEDFAIRQILKPLDSLQQEIGYPMAGEIPADLLELAAL